MQGEGLLWYLKHEMSMGLRNNWQKLLLTCIYKHKSLAMLLSVDIGMEEDTLVAAADDDDSNDNENKNDSHFVTYGKVEGKEMDFFGM
ncbi:hypothetical protein ACA910_014225 [Epithemia clementina (nom. ined.)]